MICKVLDLPDLGPIRVLLSREPGLSAEDITPAMDDDNDVHAFERSLSSRTATVTRFSARVSTAVLPSDLALSRASVVRLARPRAVRKRFPSTSNSGSGIWLIGAEVLGVSSVAR